MAKTILSVLALAGDKGAAVAVAASDLRAAIFHLCHAGQATPISDTFEALANRGKAAKVRAVVSDYWQAAAAYRAAVKRDGKLDRSGRYVGLQADNIPFSLADITAELAEAVAVVKKPKADKPAETPAETPADAVIVPEGHEAPEIVGALRDTVDAQQAENEALKAENEALKVENDALKAELLAVRAQLEAATAKAKGKAKGKAAA